MKLHLKNRSNVWCLGWAILLFEILVPAVLSQQTDSSTTFSLPSIPAVIVEAVKIRATTEVHQAWIRELNRGIPHPATGKRLSDFFCNQVPLRNALDRPAPIYRFFASPDPRVKKRVESQLLKEKFQVVDSAERADLLFFVQSAYSPCKLKKQVHGIAEMFLLGDGFADTSKTVEMRVFVVPAVAREKILDDPGLVASLSIWTGRFFPPTQVKTEISIHEIVKKFKKEINSIKKLKMVGNQKSERNSIENLSLLSQKTSPTPLDSDENREELLFRSDVALVTVLARVEDSNSRYLANLQRNDFHLFEDGVEQKITHFEPVETPWKIIFMIDTSDGLYQALPDIQKAARNFVKYLREEDHAMVISFDSNIKIGSDFTKERDLIEQAISQTSTGRGTRLYDAIDLTITERISRISGKKAILLLSDGVDTVSRLTNDERVLHLVEELDTPIYAITYKGKEPRIKPIIMESSVETSEAINFEFSETLLRQANLEGERFLSNLAQCSGGKLQMAGSIEDLSQCLKNIAEDLPTYYSLGY